jgi:hypothetical protein
MAACAVVEDLDVLEEGSLLASFAHGRDLDAVQHGTNAVLDPEPVGDPVARVEGGSGSRRASKAAWSQIGLRRGRLAEFMLRPLDAREPCGHHPCGRRALIKAWPMAEPE